MNTAWRPSAAPSRPECQLPPTWIAAGASDQSPDLALAHTMVRAMLLKPEVGSCHFSAQGPPKAAQLSTE